MDVLVTVKVDAGESGTTNDVPVSTTALNSVLFDFNPSSSNDVTEIKAMCAALISKMEKIVAVEGRSPKARMANIAITDLEKVQMVCVKALFAK
jgi:hypothetical protein